MDKQRCTCRQIAASLSSLLVLLRAASATRRRSKSMGRLSRRSIDLLLHLHARRRARHVRDESEDRLISHILSPGSASNLDTVPATGVLISTEALWVSTTATVSSARDAVSDLYGVLEELAHLVVEIAVSNKGCPDEGLVGVFGGLLLAGLVEGGGERERALRARMARRGARRRSACIAMMRHCVRLQSLLRCIGRVRVLQSYSALLSLLSLPPCSHSHSDAKQLTQRMVIWTSDSARWTRRPAVRASACASRQRPIRDAISRLTQLFIPGCPAWRRVANVTDPLMPRAADQNHSRCCKGSATRKYRAAPVASRCAIKAQQQRPVIIDGRQKNGHRACSLSPS